MLPSSDLAHSAERVCVIPNVGDTQMASCVAVSPEGVVRYWPNIAYESSTAEISAELKGEECACVVNFEVRIKGEDCVVNFEVRIKGEECVCVVNFDIPFICL